jgi:hypothetical protein
MTTEKDNLKRVVFSFNTVFMKSARTVRQRIEKKSEQLSARYKKMTSQQFWAKMNVIALRMAFLDLEEDIKQLSNDKR